MESGLDAPVILIKQNIVWSASHGKEDQGVCQKNSDSGSPEFKEERGVKKRMEEEEEEETRPRIVREKKWSDCQNRISRTFRKKIAVL